MLSSNFISMNIDRFRRKRSLSIGLAGVFLFAGMLLLVLMSNNSSAVSGDASVGNVVNVSDNQLLSANGAAPGTELHFRNKRTTADERKAAAERFKAIYSPVQVQAQERAFAAGQGVSATPAVLKPGTSPHYFGPYGNWAYSPLPRGAILNITVTNGGSGYTLPVVTVTDDYNNTGITPATATATVVGGVITSIKVTNGGSGYSAPVVVITGASTSPASATATIGGPLKGGVRKFVDKLPGLNAAGKNNLGQYIPVAVPDTTTYPGNDYYEIAVVQYSEKMHSDLNNTTLRGYVQIETPANIASSRHIPLKYPNGTAIKNATTNLPVFAHNDTQYLGPIIVSKRGVPVRVKFHNYLPTGSGGDLFIPVDTTVMGSGMGANMAMVTAATNVGTTATITTSMPHTFKVGQHVMLMDFLPSAYNGTFNVTAVPSATTFNVVLGSVPGPVTKLGSAAEMHTENRAAVHLHGGDTVWISDGTPHQWTTPFRENTNYQKGVSVNNLPDMDGGIEPQGTLTFYYTNDQSARLMFYHDHAYGITRLNVYVGMAAGYLLTDQEEQDMIAGTNFSGINPGLVKVLPDIGIPLVIQDRTFLDNRTIGGQDPTWNWGTGPRNLSGFITKAKTGDLWYPHVYMPNQNPWDITGTNAFGRWLYSPWFWPPSKPLIQGVIANPYYDPINAPWEPAKIPGVPYPSMAMEAFMDTPIVNGAAYPSLTLDPKPYRFRILNAANERFVNLQLYQATSIISNITVTNGGSGYTSPAVTISDPTGKGATAVPTVINGVISGITLLTVGSGYTNPVVNIADATGTLAAATAKVYSGLTEVGMVPAARTPGYPSNWPIDGRDGGVPDPAKMGPSFIQIGTEGGFLPAPVVIDNQPISVPTHGLLLGAAERADVIVDFSAYAGKTLILYSDSPAPYPMPDTRVDYYTNDPDMRGTGGAPTTLPGYGPNTRTIMQIKVNNIVPSAPYNLTRLNAVFASNSTKPKGGVFNASQPLVIVPQAAYNSAYNKTFTTNVSRQYIQSTVNSHTFTTIGNKNVTIPLEPKSIHDEMNVAYEVDYGRGNNFLGLTASVPTPQTQNNMMYPYPSPPVEIINDSAASQVGPTGADGTQIWRITHFGTDTHTYHFHLYNVQVVNRVTMDGIMMPPDANELGWKETVRTNPLEETMVALRPVAPKLPFKVPNSTRLIDPTMPAGAIMHGPPGGFLDPSGNPVTILNHLVNFGWEYVLHCHLLGHEEMDMMHTQAFVVAPEAPTNLVVTTGGITPTNTLTWVDNSISETGFAIQRATNSGFTVGLTTFTVGRNVVTYIDTGVVSGTKYYYRVRAVNLVGDTTVYPAPSVGFPQKTAYSGWSNTGTTCLGPDKIGNYKGNGLWAVDFNGNGSWDGAVIDRVYQFGTGVYQPVVGDWNANGKDEIGNYTGNGVWEVDFNGNGIWDGAVIDRLYQFGTATDKPVVGDWNGDGKDEIGNYKGNGVWAVDFNGNGLWDGVVIDRVYTFGGATDQPVVGDWNGDGKDEIGNYKGNGVWAVDFNGNGLWDGVVIDRVYTFGGATDQPVVGDWNGDCKDEIGNYKGNGVWAVDFNGNGLWDGVVIDRVYTFGGATDQPVVGRW